MILVTLVVVGHAWALLPNTPTTTWAYDFLYLWHVPAFVMVTGSTRPARSPSAGGTSPGW